MRKSGGSCRRSFWYGLPAVAIALLLVGLLSGCGEPSGPPEIEVRDIWARSSVAQMGVEATSAVYGTIINRGGTADRLLAGRTEVASGVEIHQTIVEGEVMRMEPLRDGVEIPPDRTVQLEPGGLHIMLIGLRETLEEGDTFPLILRFEESGYLTVEVEVRQP